jgi:S1-C subfamily serine protease
MKQILSPVVLMALIATAPGAYAQGIDAMERDVVDLVEDISQSVVSVAAVAQYAHVSKRPPLTAPQAKSVGCGIVFDDDGLILTTASIVGYAKQVEIGTRDGSRYRGSVIGTDPARDLAIVKVDGARLRPARFADDARIRPGSLVFILGNAFGSLPSVSMGFLSSAQAPGEGEVEPMMRLSVPINPGEIGGPVVNARGEVIGVVIGRLTFQSRYRSVWMREGSAFGLTGGLQPSNMSVAMPSGRALGIAREIVESGGREQGYLGVQVLDLSDEYRVKLGELDISGVVVANVVQGSPAESIGIRPGDVITTFGPKAVESVSYLHGAVIGRTPGELVSITYLRGSRTLSEAVRLGRHIPDYVREASFGEDEIGPDEIRERIRNLKIELEELNRELKDLEDG